MIAHILPCFIEAEIIAAAVYLVAHARELLGLLTAWMRIIR